MSDQTDWLKLMLEISARETARKIRAAPSDLAGQQEIMDTINGVAVSTFQRFVELIDEHVRVIERMPLEHAECGEVGRAVATRSLRHLAGVVAKLETEYKREMGMP